MSSSPTSPESDHRDPITGLTLPAITPATRRRIAARFRHLPVPVRVDDLGRPWGYVASVARWCRVSPRAARPTLLDRIERVQRRLWDPQHAGDIALAVTIALIVFLILISL